MGEPKLTGTHDTHALTLSPCARARAQGGHWYVRLRAAGQMDNQSPTKIHQGRGRHIEVWSQTRAPHQRNCFAAIKEVSRSCGRRSPHDPGKMITKRVLYTEGDWVERGEPDGTRSVFVVRACARVTSPIAPCVIKTPASRRCRAGAAGLKATTRRARTTHDHSGQCPWL